MAEPTPAHWLLALVAVLPACFDPSAELRGKPCTGDASCGELSCDYGVCGGPSRCAAGAGIGDYCFTLTEPVFAVGEGPSTLAVGLVDADPRLDVVVGNADSRTLSLLLNDGAGGFAPAISSGPLGDVATELTIGDVDSHGLADVVASTAANALLVVPIGRAGGTPAFGPVAIAASGLASPSRPRVGDFVDDPFSTPDVAVLVEGGLDVRAQGEQSLVFGSELLTAVEGASDIRVLGQGAERAYVASADEAAIVSLSRNPSGLFSPRSTIPVGAPPRQLVLADLDADDYADLLTVDVDGGVWLTRGKNAALDEFHMPVPIYDIGFAPTQFAAANLDDDDALELVIAGGIEGGRRDVYLFDNDGDGNPIYGGSIGLDDATAVALTDLEPDGVPELVVIEAATGRVRIVRRTVAPPPPGSHEGGSTSGVLPSDTGQVETTPMEGTDPSSPGETSDPTFETSEPSCDGMLLGPTCYVPYGTYATNGSGLAQLAVGDITLDGYDDLVATDASLGVWVFPSTQTSPPAPLEQTPGAFAYVPDAPTGLAIGLLDLENYIGYAVVTHLSGVSARGYVSPEVDIPAPSEIDLPLGQCSHPLVEWFTPEASAPQIVFEHDGGVGFVDDPLGQADFYFSESGSVTDLDLLPLTDFGLAVVAATQEGLVPYLLLAGGEVSTEPVLPWIPGPRSNVAVSLYSGSIISTDSFVLDALTPAEREGEDPIATSVGGGDDIGDMVIGDFDADGYDDFVVIVGQKGDAPQLHFWLYHPGPYFEGPSIVDVPGLAAVAIRRGYGEFGEPLPSEILIGTTDGTIQHFAAGYVTR
jgi:hypothetical protein